jgi:hypothetical protein
MSSNEMAVHLLAFFFHTKEGSHRDGHPITSSQRVLTEEEVRLRSIVLKALAERPQTCARACMDIFRASSNPRRRSPRSSLLISLIDNFPDIRSQL